jgi:hypothetical protein
MTIPSVTVSYLAKWVVSSAAVFSQANMAIPQAATSFLEKMAIPSAAVSYLANGVIPSATVSYLEKVAVTHLPLPGKHGVPRGFFVTALQ